MIDTAKFKGIIAPIVSPCDEEDKLDWDKLEQNFHRLIQTAIDGMYINGGTGDGERLTIEERKEVAAYMVPRLKEAGKTAIVHVGQTFQRAAVELAKHAATLGADAVASIPPRASWDEIVDYYTALTVAGLPVFVYYIPGMTGVTATFPQIKRLLQIEGVIGIKMSDWNLFMLRQAKLAFPEKVIYSGYDEMLSLGLLYGADGSIGTWANLLPELYTAIYRLVQAKEYEKVMQLQDKFTAFLAVGWNYGIIDTFEELMYAKGYATRCFRRPSTWNKGAVEPTVIADLIAKMDEINTMVAAF